MTIIEDALVRIAAVLEEIEPLLVQLVDNNEANYKIQRDAFAMMVQREADLQAAIRL